MVAQHPPSENPQLDLLAERLPRKPYCSNDGTASLIRTRSHALKHRYIQPNPPTLVFWLLFDLDEDAGWARWAAEDAGVAPPNYCVLDGTKGTGHLYYGLEVPVCRSDAAGIKPLRFLAAVEGAYRDALGADASYGGLIAKNPYHPDWHTAQLADQLYDLTALAEHPGVGDLNKRPETDGRRRLDYGAGRNVTLFEKLRRWSYRRVLDYKRQGADYGAWWSAVAAQALKLNDFAPPLPVAEVKATTKSVAKWTWRHFTLDQLSHIQAQRGAQKGRDRREALRPFVDEMAAQGYSQRQIAEALDLPRPTVQTWLRGG